LKDKNNKNSGAKSYKNGTTNRKKLFGKVIFLYLAKLKNSTLTNLSF